ncbi:MAG: hypothetical protein MUO26_15790, partial [Methanotrichaceae archaeon]|nr:hypothetical protein [Methanotrichaceae archaeon]
MQLEQLKSKLAQTLENINTRWPILRSVWDSLLTKFFALIRLSLLIVYFTNYFLGLAVPLVPPFIWASSENARYI